RRLGGGWREAAVVRRPGHIGGGAFVSWKTLRAPRFLGGVGIGAALAIAAVVATNATGGGRSLVTAGINGLDYAPPDMVLYNGKDAIDQLALKAKYVKPGSWVWITSGWNINQFGQRGMFTQAELDQAFPNNPVDIRAAGFTGSAANSMTLKVLALTTTSTGV